MGKELEHELIVTGPNKLKPELIIVVKLVKCFKWKISACGFFRVNRKLYAGVYMPYILYSID